MNPVVLGTQLNKPFASEIPHERLLQIRGIAFDFDGVFTDNFVDVSDDGRETVRCSRADGIGLMRLRILGIQSVIISTEVNPVVGQRAQKLQMECVQAVVDKADALKRWATSKNIKLDQTIFLGNDVNDLPALKICGIAIGVRDSHPSIYPNIEFMTGRSGGQGAVREICDLIADAQDYG